MQDTLYLNDMLAITYPAISSEPDHSTSFYEISISYRETRGIPDDTVDATFRTYESLSFGIGLVPPLKVYFLVWIKLIAAIEAGTNRACKDVFLMKDGRFVCLFDEIS